MPEEEQELRYVSFFLCASSVLLMRKKAINRQQHYYLIDFILQNSNCETYKHCAYAFTAGLDKVQESFTYIDFPYTASPLIKNISRKRKRLVIEKLIILMLMDKESENSTYTLIADITQEIGLGGEIGYLRRAISAEKQYARFPEFIRNEAYEESYQIVQDALSRTSLEISS